jgi:hypothetical protein
MDIYEDDMRSLVVTNNVEMTSLSATNEEQIKDKLQLAH